uniref:Gypsy retrotransposon integrase-like protein 1 n=1 Tax=Oryzias melastigma TaxID=30732 RepID=A0A3B3BXR1_ORYME
METSVFNQLYAFLANGELPKSDSQRRKIRRMAPKYTTKDGRLFYTGPSYQYMRSVIMSAEEKRIALMECHDNPGGNHNGVRGTRDRVVAGYYWPTITQDVEEWVKSCHRCQLNDPIKTVARVLHPIKVKEPWEVLGMDLIGPLPETREGNKYILTMTDLFTKWVIAEPLKTKTAAEVSAILTTKLYTFGMVRKIITDQGKEFVNQVKVCESRTNQNIKRALRKYVNSKHNDWDVHLAAVVYGINTAKQVFFHCYLELLVTCLIMKHFKTVFIVLKTQ